MGNWLQTRGRKILSLLSDIGGALALVVLATGLIAAAIAGAVLAVTTAFPQPYLTLLVLGIALLAAGLALHFLRNAFPSAKSGAAPDLTAPLHEASRTSQPRPGASNPYSQAAAMQRRHDNSEERKALRRVREELRDDRRHVQRAHEGDIRQIQQISFQAWFKDEETLLAMADATPHSAARHAYRELGGIQDVLYIRESASTLRLRKQPKDLLETDVHTTYEAIDAAVERLSAADDG